ncbi:MAG: class I SAM-dependent methyltransferase, partial [Actinomycetota bacterium]|nr:class I SAM-dependent methyltransferase [Actinomycetota bacterium]
MAERLISQFPWRFPRRFGLLEVAMYTAGGSLDFVRRHMTIVNELEQLRRGSRLAKLDVLDFGGGHSPLSPFLRLYGLRANYRVTVADVSAEAIGAAQLASPLVAKELLSQEGSLPFPAGKFDVVVSSDVFEHIPRGFREHWAGELKRVSRIGQIHNVPCDG